MLAAIINHSDELQVCRICGETSKFYVSGFYFPDRYILSTTECLCPHSRYSFKQIITEEILKNQTITHPRFENNNSNE
jgi:hypothetical protein